MDITRLGQVLRERRLALGLVQREVAESAGITGAYVSEAELGSDKLTLRTLIRIASALKATLMLRVIPDEAGSSPSNEDLELLDMLRQADPQAKEIAEAILRRWSALDPAHRVTLRGMLDLWGAFSSSERAARTEGTAPVKKVSRS